MKRITKPWSPEEKALLTSLYRKDKSAREIAGVLGRSVESIHSAVRNFNLVTTAQPISFEEFANRVERDVKAEVKQSCDQKILITPERKAQAIKEYTPRELMLELRRRGYKGYLTYEEIKVHKISIEEL